VSADDSGHLIGHGPKYGNVLRVGMDETHGRSIRALDPFHPEATVDARNTHVIGVPAEHEKVLLPVRGYASPHIVILLNTLV
jgi:hypothetical protein